jgi:hypothetical protein
MVDSLQFLLLCLAIVVSLSGLMFQNSELILNLKTLATKGRLVNLSIGIVTFCGGLALAGIFHEPVPRIHDELSYVLMSNTFGTGHVSNPAPPLPEFFDTFHVLVHPIYASKYFPVQGVLLAIGEKLTGHPAVGVWLSAGLACAITCWMLQAWVGSVWGMLGGVLMMLQYGILSYWSQSYWGGMAGHQAAPLKGCSGICCLAQNRPLSRTTRSLLQRFRYCHRPIHAIDRSLHIRMSVSNSVEWVRDMDREMEPP